jgi:hypothetical protein
MGLTRKARGSGRKSKKGGSLLSGVVGALKTALPSIVLYEALRTQGKRRRHAKKGGAKKKSHKKRHSRKARKSHKKRHSRKARKSHKKRTHRRRRR